MEEDPLWDAITGIQWIVAVEHGHLAIVETQPVQIHHLHFAS